MEGPENVAIDIELLVIIKQLLVTKSNICVLIICTNNVCMRSSVKGMIHELLYILQ